MSRELYINSNLIELSDSEKIAITKQVNDIAELTDRQANHTNQFRILLTEPNRKSLYFSDTVQGNTRAPYRKLPARYYEDGELLVDGYAVIDQSDINNVGILNCTLYDGIFDLFNIIGETKLTEIDWSELDHDFTITEVLTHNEDNGAIVWPLINWGAYIKGDPIDIQYQVPCIKESYILQKIFEFAGYDYSGLVLEESIFQKSVISLNASEVINDEQTKIDNSALLISRENSFITTSEPVGRRGQPQPDKTGKKWNGVNGFMNLLNWFRYTTDINGVNHASAIQGDNFVIQEATIFGKGRLLGMKKPVYVHLGVIDETKVITVHLKYFSSIIYRAKVGRATETITEVDSSLICGYIEVLKNGVLYNKYEITNTVNNVSDIDYSVSLLVNTNDEITLVLRTINIIPPSKYENHTSSVAIDLLQAYQGDYSYIQFESTDPSTIGETINYNAIIPDISMKDFLRCFANKYALIYQVDGPTSVKLTMFKEIRDNIADTEDWSDKFDPEQPYQIGYRIGSYGQNNFARYSPDPSEDLNQLGDAAFKIDDQNLPINNTIFEVIYSASKAYNSIINTVDQPITGNTGVNIPRYTLTEADQYQPYTDYDQGDLVQFGDQVWININPSGSTGSQPAPTNPDWELYNRQFTQTVDTNYRSLLVRYMSLVDTDVIDYTDGTLSDTQTADKCLMAYFIDAQQSDQLGFNTLLARYYDPIIDMMNRLKVVNCYMRLTKRDMRMLDFNRLKYVKFFDNYFYLNKVEQYIEGKSSLVQLIRL